MKIKANLLYKPTNFQMDDCLIEKVVELSHEEFCKLKITPLADQPVIIENSNYMYGDDNTLHCLLALDQDSQDGVLIEAEGYDYARYAAYIPGMRDIVNAEMDRAADYIIRQGAENTGVESWRVSFKELEEALGLTVWAGSGLDSMLRTALKRRPEVDAVDIHDGCVELECRQRMAQAPDERPMGFTMQ